MKIMIDIPEEIYLNYKQYVILNKEAGFERLGHLYEIIGEGTPVGKEGDWINDRCSECGKGIEDLIDSREWYENEQPNFCPFCGTPIRK